VWKQPVVAFTGSIELQQQPATVAPATCVIVRSLCRASLFSGQCWSPAGFPISSRMFTGSSLADWTRANWFQAHYRLFELHDYLRLRKKHYFLHLVNDWSEDVCYGLDDKKIGFRFPAGAEIFLFAPENLSSPHVPCAHYLGG